jgi:hypothetical protein
LAAASCLYENDPFVVQRFFIGRAQRSQEVFRAASANGAERADSAYVRRLRDDDMAVRATVIR